MLKHDEFVVITLDKETNQLLFMWKDEKKEEQSYQESNV